MKNQLKLILLISTLLVGCQNNKPTEQPTQTPTEEVSVEPTLEPTQQPSVEQTQVPTEGPTEQPTEIPTVEPTQEPTEEPTAEPTVEPTQEPTAEFEVINDEAFRLSSIYDTNNESGLVTYKMYCPYDDNYSLKCNEATSLKVYNENKQLITIGNTTAKITVNKNQIIYISIETEANKSFRLFTTAEKHLVELPYEINSSVDLNSLQTYSDSSSDPLKAAEISYTKRDIF